MHETNRPSPRALRGLAEFFRLEAAGGIVLILAAGLALLLVNSPMAEMYRALLAVPVQVSVGAAGIASSARYISAIGELTRSRASPAARISLSLIHI